MIMNLRGLSKVEINEIMKEEAERESALRKRNEEDRLWAQRKYELSNSFGEDLIYFDDKLRGFYSEGLDNPCLYDVDRFECLIPSKDLKPDNLQNTRGYNYAFVSK